MTVPITSDLSGYQAFWLRLFCAAGVLFSLTGIAIGVLLWKIWRVAETIQFILSSTASRN